MNGILPVRCSRCRKPVAEIVRPDGLVRAAQAGTVTEVAGRDGSLRLYEVACSARHRREVRRWNPATLAGAYHAYADRPWITMDDIRRNVPKPAPRAPRPNPAQGASGWRPAAPR